MSLSEQGDILIREFFAGEPTEDRFQELEQWLRKDPEHVKLLAEFAVIERLLFVEQKQLDASAILALLLEDEENAKPAMVSILSPEDFSTPADPISFRQAASAIGYLISHSIRQKPSLVAGIAAAALLAFVLLGVVLFGPDHNPGLESAPLASEDPTNEPTEPAVDRSVATLTGEQNAQWQAVSGTILPSVGDQLQLGQRLTLTDGLAEITTHRGAIAVIEAPCMIEVTDDNSLYLFNGKLLGICETPSSQGFVVRAPWMDVIDLGTRFGVDATRNMATQVQVFEGEVKVAPSSEEGERPEFEQVLTAGQSVTGRRESLSPVIEAEDLQQFAVLQEAGQLSTPPAERLAGVQSIAGDLKIASSAEYIGREHSQWPTSNQAVIFHDFIGPLFKDLELNASELATNTMPAGSTVRSYVIFKTGNRDDVESIVNGSVTFDNEVIGIITDQAAADLFEDAIRASSPIFKPGRDGDGWIEPNAFGEEITLSEDRRTVTFSFKVKESTDTIRVLVRTDASIQRHSANED